MQFYTHTYTKITTKHHQHRHHNITLHFSRKQLFKLCFLCLKIGCRCLSLAVNVSYALVPYMYVWTTMSRSYICVSSIQFYCNQNDKRKEISVLNTHTLLAFVAYIAQETRQMQVREEIKYSCSFKAKRTQDACRSVPDVRCKLGLLFRAFTLFAFVRVFFFPLPNALMS